MRCLMGLATKLSADCCSLAQNPSRRPVLGYERLRSSSANRRRSKGAGKESSYQASAVEKPLSSGRTANHAPMQVPTNAPVDIY